jgi:hypothetical protein
MLLGNAPPQGIGNMLASAILLLSQIDFKGYLINL